MYWESARGCVSVLDGMSVQQLLSAYEIWYVTVPPLEAGRVPSPLGPAVAPEGGLSRAV